MRRALPICAAALAGGCVDGPPANLCDGGPCPSEHTVEQVFQVAENRMLDVLFVVDDTAGIAPYEDMLAAGFAANAQALRYFPGGIPELHFGLISSSLCGGAPATRAQACGVAAPTAYGTVDTCGQHVNFSDSLDTTFSCLGDFGVGTCTSAQPLAAVRRLLESPPPGWEGFLRPAAALLIVFVAGEDDASPDDVASTVSFIRSLKADPTDDILLAAIVPPVTDCTAVPPTASLPPRLTAFVNSAGANGLIGSICNGGLGQALEVISVPLALQIVPPCVRGVRDNDPATPGIQGECTVVETTRTYDGTSTTTVLPSCDQALPPCWTLSPPGPGLAGACPDGLFVNVNPLDLNCPAQFTRLQIECLGCVDPADPACQGS
jgi:hypothetical protein